MGRSTTKPYSIRMMAEVGCDFALWGPIDEEPPSSVHAPAGSMLEDVLPISAGLRERLLAWARLYYRYDGGERQLSMDGFGECGYALSRALCRQLDDRYRVTYYLTFAGDHRDVLRARAGMRPLQGWRLR
jgi:hypothetical protein